MAQKRIWSTPVLQNHGPAASITQNNINFNKKIGTGDSILLVINGVSTVVNNPTGGSLINTTVK
jgi:hypothetical protein